MRFVLGHKIPDTDAICSALVYAQFLNDQGIFAQAIAL
jgi:inorganic pyrophosphatase/exopolyphosphatase